MKIKLYLVYGIVICSLFIAGWARGVVVSSMSQAPKWGASGHGMYHK